MARADETFEQLGMPSELVSWTKSRTGVSHAWETCPRGDWLLALAIRVGVPRPSIVGAAADCARVAMRLLPVGELRPRRAVDAAERWARGQVTGAACWALAFQSSGVAAELEETDRAASDAAAAAACVAFACDADAEPSYYASRAHAAEAAFLAARAYHDTNVNAHLVYAELVRGRIPLSEVASRLGVAVRSTRPPPPDVEKSRSEALWFDPITS